MEPFRIYGNTWYVGVRGIATVLVDTGQGLVLLDGGLPQSAPLIEANVRKLGFKPADIKLILNSHGHFDHAGGIAALQRDSGAQVVASPSGAEALRLGHAVPDDPQTAFGNGDFPALPVSARVLADGDTLRLGDTALTAHFTPGHTPGSTSWTWQSCDKRRCLTVAYVDSLNAISAPGFRFTGGKGQADRTPAFRASIDKVAALPCDVIVTVHPEFGHLWEKLAARDKGIQPDPFVDAGACRAYAAEARKLLDQRVAEEQSGKAD